MVPSIKPNRATLVGIAGSNKAFSLSLYNLKAYVYREPLIRNSWDMNVIQHPLIGVTNRSEKVLLLAQKIAQTNPTLVGFSCYMWNLHAFHELAVLLRKMVPEVLILWGGPEMTTDYVQAGKLDDYEMDFCVSGEGEATFLELLLSLPYDEQRLLKIAGLSFRPQQKVPFKINEKRTPFKSLLEIPSPFLSGVVDDEVLFRPDIEANLETQRGCTLRCSYCIYHKDMGKISYSSAERTLNEILFVLNKGVKRIRFVDANFSSELDHAKSVMRGLIQVKAETKLMFELIPGFIDEELAALFAEFNALHSWNEVTLGIGVQTINYDILKKMRRGIKVERFEATFALLEKYKIFAKIDLIIGLPGENIQSIERTLEYMIEKLRHSRAHLLCCHAMRGLPGTELIDIAKEHQMVFSSQNEPHELMESPVLPRKEMVLCLRRTAVIFRLINHSGWASREFISHEESFSTSIRDAFFAARQRLGVSNIGLIDLLIDGLMEHLRARNSWFVQENFPFAETWWWSWSRVEIKDAWILKFLDSLGTGQQSNKAGATIPMESSLKG